MAQVLIRTPFGNSIPNAGYFIDVLGSMDTSFMLENDSVNLGLDGN